MSGPTVPDSIPDPNRIEDSFEAIRIKQPIGELIVARMTHKQIQRITYFDVRRVLREERDVERYLGIQRPLNDKRVAELKEYVNFLDATFPTAIIVSVDSDYADYDAGSRKLVLRNTRKGESVPDIAFRNLCRVIDGQHRIAGLEGFTGRDFETLVSVFIGSDVADQAYVFATVNLEQSKVSKSLAYDLFELARTRSPFKTCHNIAVALDQTEGGPFFHRIKRLGVTTEGRYGETLTQATFVNCLVPYISDEPKVDRDLLLRGQKIALADADVAKRLIFRNLFLADSDVKIGQIVEAYFTAVARRWPEAWSFDGTGMMLNRTNGFRALMRVLRRAYLHFTKPGGLVSEDEFYSLFRRAGVPWDYFTVDRFQPGSSGEGDLVRFLEQAMFQR